MAFHPGLFHGGRVPLGKRVVRRMGYKILVPDQESRMLTSFVYTERNKVRPWREIGDECERRLAQLQDRNPRSTDEHDFDYWRLKKIVLTQTATKCS